MKYLCMCALMLFCMGGIALSDIGANDGEKDSVNLVGHDQRVRLQENESSGESLTVDNTVLPDSPSQFLQTDLVLALRALLKEQPEVILDVLRSQPIELAALVEQASYLSQVEAEKTRRLNELRQPKVSVIDAKRPIRGNPEAPITIVEYSDFECPFCRTAFSTVKQVLEQHKDRIRFVYKHNPLNFHEMAEPAARYFEAIAMQDMEEAWRFHDRVFEQQDLLENGESVLKAIVATLKVDRKKLETDLKGDIVEQRLQQDREEAERFGFDGTPAFLINGVSLMGSQPQKDFEDIIQLINTEQFADKRLATSNDY
ncbi:DsbA family protein [Nitrospira sp. M1]